MSAAPPLRPGDERRSEVRLDAAAVRAFAEAVGDRNPIHWDAAFAARTRFGRPIVHGTLLTSLLGKVMGMEFPGPGTIYLEHRLRFLLPVFVGESVALRVAVAEALPRDRYRLTTQVLGPAGDLRMDGEALVWRPT